MLIFVFLMLENKFKAIEWYGYGWVAKYVQPLTATITEDVVRKRVHSAARRRQTAGCAAARQWELRMKLLGFMPMAIDLDYYRLGPEDL